MNEEWRVIAEFPDYAVSSEGRVKRAVLDRRGRVGGILKPYLEKYAAVTLYRDGKQCCALVHRLVCIAFDGPQPTPLHEVAHSDGNGHHNHQGNLRWATRVENEADKILHGTNPRGKPSRVPVEHRPRGPTHGRNTKPESTARGERNGRTKLSEVKVSEIRLDHGSSRKQLAAAYGISVTMVGFIQRGISWSHVPMPQPIGEAP